MKHILIINPNNDTFSNPTLVSLLEELLLNANVKISLLAPQQVIAPPSQFEALNFVDFSPFSVTWSKKIWKWFSKWKEIKRLNNFCQSEAVSCVIGVDPLGLIVAGRIKKALPGIQLHYLSFEIFYKEELQNQAYYLKVKEKEVHYSAFVDCLIIQDEERKNLLLEENRIREQKMKLFLIPVAPDTKLIPGENRSYWRKKLHIPEEKIVLLQSGSLAKWSGGEQLLELLKQALPENILLLIHSKGELEPTNPIHQQLLAYQAANSNVLIHASSFSDYSEYLAFLQVADLGLALYEADLSSPYTGKNITNIGLASGKFSCYLSQHLPAMVSYSKSFEKIQAVSDFGYLVKDVSDIRQQLVSLKKEDLPGKQKNAALVYEELLNPALAIKNYSDYLYEHN